MSVLRFSLPLSGEEVGESGKRGRKRRRRRHLLLSPPDDGDGDGDGDGDALFCGAAR